MQYKYNIKHQNIILEFKTFVVTQHKQNVKILRN